MYGFLADLVVAIHVGYVSYVVLGQLLIVIGWLCGWGWVRNFWFRITHLVAMGVVVYEELMNIRCPLSIWEEQLRTLANQPVNGDTFMGRMLHSLIFYDAPPWVFTVGYLSFGSIILITFIFCLPNRPAFARRKPQPVSH